MTVLESAVVTGTSFGFVCANRGRHADGANGGET